MSTKLRIGGATGLEVYAIIRNVEDEVWDGTAFVTFAIADKDDYDISLTEQGSTGYYSVDFPSAIVAGTYHINYHARLVSGQVDLTTPDDVIHQEVKEWDGTTIVDSLVNQASITDICNMALGHLGSSLEIANYETENSQEARACRRYFEPARDTTLKKFPWPFATQFYTLGLVEEDPTTEWAFSYRYPSDTLQFRRLLSGTRNDTRQSRVPYRVVKDSAGLLIYTDCEDAVGEYTVRVSNASFYPVDFTLALSYLLASMIAPQITSGDQFKLGEKALKMWDFEINQARADAWNEQQDEEVPESEFVRARS